MLTIRGRALGSRRTLFDDFSIPPPDDLGDGGPLTLRDLIEHIVRREISAFERREAARRLDRVLSGRQIDAGVERGKVSAEGRDPKLFAKMPHVDPDDAVRTALIAFEDGLYLVVIDEHEYRSLDDIVRLDPDSRITFLRLTFLAGA